MIIFDRFIKLFPLNPIKFFLNLKLIYYELYTHNLKKHSIVFELLLF